MIFVDSAKCYKFEAMKLTIYIKDYFPVMISTRKAITNLSSKVKLEAKNEYTFDFTDIVFVSRSFTDEFLKFLKSTNAKWQLKNTNSNVKAMLDAVKKSQEFNKNDFDYVAITRFKNKADLNSFLATI
jgi:hypothetical protein